MALAGCTAGAGGGYGIDRGDSNYDYDRPDPAYGGYDAGRYYRYYRNDRRYRQRRLVANERVYRGQDGRYYCRRKDGATA